MPVPRRHPLAALVPQTLRARLALLVLVSLLGALWLFTLLVNAQQERRLQELLAAQQFAAVGYVAEDIDNKIRLRLDGLAMIANRFPVASLGSERRTRDFLVERRAIYNLFDGGLIVVKPDGDGAFADFPQMPGRLTNRYGELSPFREVIATGRATVGPPRMGRALNKPVVVFAAPIFADNGRLAAILAGVTSLNAPNFLDLVAKPRPGTRGDYLVVAPVERSFVTGTDPGFTLKPLPAPGANAMLDRYLSGYEGSGVALSSAGIEELSSARRLPTTGWLVVGRLPTTEGFAPIRESRQFTLAGAAALSLLIALATLFSLRRAMRPLSDAAAEMEAMTRGDAPLHALPVPGHDDIAVLVGSFNRLQDRVRGKEQELRDSGATYRGIFDSVGEAIYVRDEDGVILDVNAGAELMYGMARDEFVGCTVEPLAAPGRNDMAAIGSAFDQALAGMPQQFECWGRKRDGSEFLKEVRLYPGSYFGRRAVIAIARDITSRRQAEEATRRAERRFATVFSTSPIPIAIARVADGRFVEVNDALLRLLGRRRAEMIGHTSVEIGYWADAAARTDWLAALQRDNELHGYAVTLCDGEGRNRHVLMYSSFIEFGDEPCTVNFLHDITEQRQAEQNLRLMANVFSHSHDGMIITDTAANIVDVNPSFTDFTGYARDEVVGRNPRFLQSGRHGPDFYSRLWASIAQEGMWQGEIWNRKKNGELIAEMLTISAVPAAGNEPTKYVGIFTDITRLKETQAELEQLAHYDALTGLPNRALLRDRLVQAVAHARRRHHLLGVCFVDLDGFKPINDSHGHEAGDHLLVEVAHKLKEVVRGGDTVARLGGDEFVILLTQVRDLIEIETALQRLVGAITHPCEWNGRTLQVSASVGVTVYPHDGADPETLLRHADLAMYAAKQAGRNRFNFFDAGQDRQVREQFERQARLREALENGELVLYYQPKVHMRSGQTVGAEALIRWQHPVDGLKPPGQFLPFAEESDLIVDIGNWTIRTAMRQVLEWRRQGLHLPVGVNIAARHVQRPDFVAGVRDLLAEFAELPPFSVEFEIVETSALEDMAGVRRAIEECARLGVHFALDDFGTGYSSLIYLRSLPVKCLKIDGSFVQDMGTDPHDLAIVEGVVGMGIAFGRTVVAEGVETEDQGQLLLQLGCEIAQGYGVARPMPAEQILPWVYAYQPHTSWQSDESAHWRREDFSLLAAEVDHRYWVENVLGALDDDPAAGKTRLPPLDARECRFGRWYHHEGRERYGDLAGYRTIDALHEAIHATANRALAAAEAGRREEAGRLGHELAAHRDSMVAALRDLRRAVVAARKARRGTLAAAPAA